jgi:hypothetical protein
MADDTLTSKSTNTHGCTTIETSRRRMEEKLAHFDKAFKNEKEGNK